MFGHLSYVIEITSTNTRTGSSLMRAPSADNKQPIEDDAHEQFGCTCEFHRRVCGSVEVVAATFLRASASFCLIRLLLKILWAASQIFTVLDCAVAVIIHCLYIFRKMLDLAPAKSLSS